MHHSACVYTCIFGDYEDLNEVEVKSSSDIPFICFTDDPKLKSKSWQIRCVKPIFTADPLRSQRAVKLLAHKYLPEFERSLYIDNSVRLKVAPEVLFDRFLSGYELAIPSHSYHEKLLDEFIAVARGGLDDNARIFEQLNHYQLFDPESLAERPFWSAIILRDHNSKPVCKAFELWFNHVLRYSRRDQLSANVCLQNLSSVANVIKIDNYRSDFHSWPHSNRRDRKLGLQNIVTSQMPSYAQLRERENITRELTDKLTTTKEELLSTQAILKKVLRSKSWRATEGLRKASGFIRNGFARDNCSDQFAVCANGRRIYVDASDQRGKELIKTHGNFNPKSLKLWKQLLASQKWDWVIDVGANYGEMILNADLTDNTSVLLLEPNPRILPYLSRSIKESKIKATTLSLALSSGSGSVDFHVNRSWSGKSAIYHGHDLFNGEQIETIKVNTITVAELIDKFIKDTKQSLLFKIDVEGVEIAILKEALESLQKLQNYKILLESLHMSDQELEWLSDNFTIELFSNQTETIIPIPKNTTLRQSVLNSGEYYPQDIVIQSKLKKLSDERLLSAIR